MKIYKNVLNETTIEKIYSLIKKTSTDFDPSWCTSYSWNKNIVEKSSFVLIYKLSQNKKILNLVLNDLKKLKEFKIKNIHVMIYIWGIGSYIPFHEDPVSNIAATIYLNKTWDKNDGGLFLYETKKGVKGVVPEYNKMIVNDKNESHCVTSVLPSIKEERFTLQIFGNNV